MPRKPQAPFSLVNGRVMRLVRLDGCGRPVYGASSVAVSDGFISVALKTNTTSTDAVQTKNANGQLKVNVPAKTSFSNVTADITFTGVDPEVYALITGQRALYDAFGQPDGFSVDSAIDLSDSGYALEVWAGVPGGDACAVGADGSFAYALYPFLSGGVIGDHTFAEGAINFSVTGAASKDGNAWGKGLFKVVLGSDSQPAVLPTAVATTEHIVIKRTGVQPPEPFDGTRPLLDPTVPAVTDITATPTTGHTVTLGVSPAPDASTPVWWTFGDGEDTWDYVDGATTSFTYAAAGSYTVTASTNGVVFSKTITVS